MQFGAKPEGFLRLSDLVGAVGDAGLKVDTDSWRLKPQGLAIQVSCERPLKDTAVDELIGAFPGARIRVIGRLQEQDRTCIVLRLSDRVDYTAFSKHLSARGVELRDDLHDRDANAGQRLVIRVGRLEVRRQCAS